MLLIMAVTLYTSRVVLNTLGVEDYGIYNVIGGVVTMLSFFNNSMATAVQRFLNYEMGKGNLGNIVKIFSVSFLSYCFIAIIVLLLAETVGLWFVLNKLVIPADRLDAALWVYQFTIVTFIVNLLSVPYNATIIAHEKMSVFAYISILEESRNNMIAEGYNPNKLKAVVINYPNNPLGCTMTREYAKSVVDFCKKYNLVLISDTAYADLYFNENNKPFSILEIEGAKDCAVEFFSFSKPYAMTGWRLGWVCGNSEIVSIFGKLKSTLDTGIFRAIQKAGAAILLAKEGEEYIKEKNLGFKRKQEIFIKGLKELGWEGIYEPEATFYLWLPIPPRYKTSKEFTDDLLRTSGVVVVPGSGFGKYGEGFFRASIVCSDEKLQECIDRMKADGFYFK